MMKLYIKPTKEKEYIEVLTASDVVSRYSVPRHYVYYHGTVARKFRVFKHTNVVYVDVNGFKSFLKASK